MNTFISARIRVQIKRGWRNQYHKYTRLTDGSGLGVGGREGQEECRCSGRRGKEYDWGGWGERDLNVMWFREFWGSYGRQIDMTQRWRTHPALSTILSPENRQQWVLGFSLKQFLMLACSCVWSPGDPLPSFGNELHGSCMKWSGIEGRNLSYKLDSVIILHSVIYSSKKHKHLRIHLCVCMCVCTCVCENAGLWSCPLRVFQY